MKDNGKKCQSIRTEGCVGDGYSIGNIEVARNNDHRVAHIRYYISDENLTTPRLREREMSYWGGPR